MTFLNKIKSLFNLSVLRKVFSLMSKREKTIAGVLFLILISILSWYSFRLIKHSTVIKPSEGGQYSESFVGQPQFLNPLLAQTTLDTSLVHLLYDGLYTYDESGKLIPDLADGMPKISRDQKQYTVTLKQGIKWHNNNPITTKDIAFTINLLKNPEYKSPLYSLWQNTTIKIIDDNTLVFINKDVSGPFIHNLTLPILPEAVWGKISAGQFSSSTLNLEAIGSGAYKIIEINRLPNKFIYSIHLTANNNYHLGKPLIPDVLLRFYKTQAEAMDAFNRQEVSAIGFSPYDDGIENISAKADSKTNNVPVSEYQALFFNTRKYPFSQSNFRKALAQALNRTGLATSVFNDNATAISSPFPLEFDITDNNITTQNLDQAKKLLLNDGFQFFYNTHKLHKNGVPVTITITTNENPYNKKTAELIANEWGDLGIDVKINSIPTSDLLKTVIKPRDFEVILFAQKLGGDPDPFALWHSSQVNDPGLNFTGFINPEADSLLTSAQTSTENEDQIKALQKWNKIFLDNTPAIILSQPHYLFITDNTLNITNFTFLPEPEFRLSKLYKWSAANKRVIAWPGK
jgi:peptide/nickel transport system substrate-binding protein